MHNNCATRDCTLQVLHLSFGIDHPSPFLKVGRLFAKSNPLQEAVGQKNRHPIASDSVDESSVAPLPSSLLLHDSVTWRALWALNLFAPSSATGLGPLPPQLCRLLLLASRLLASSSRVVMPRLGLARDAKWRLAASKIRCRSWVVTPSSSRSRSQA